MDVVLLHEHHYYQLILIPVKIMKQLPHYATLRSPQAKLLLLNNSNNNNDTTIQTPQF
jgi:hypothetical protein